MQKKKKNLILDLMYQNSRNAEFVVLWFVFVIIKTNNRLLSTHFKEKDFFSVTSSFIIY